MDVVDLNVGASLADAAIAAEVFSTVEVVERAVHAAQYVAQTVEEGGDGISNRDFDLLRLGWPVDVLELRTDAALQAYRMSAASRPGLLASIEYRAGAVTMRRSLN